MIPQNQTVDLCTKITFPHEFIFVFITYFTEKYFLKKSQKWGEGWKKDIKGQGEGHAHMLGLVYRRGWVQSFHTIYKSIANYLSLIQQYFSIELNMLHLRKIASRYGFEKNFFPFPPDNVMFTNSSWK